MAIGGRPLKAVPFSCLARKIVTPLLAFSWRYDRTSSAFLFLNNSQMFTIQIHKYGVKLLIDRHFENGVFWDWQRAFGEKNNLFTRGITKKQTCLTTGLLKLNVNGLYYSCTRCVWMWGAKTSNLLAFFPQKLLDKPRLSAKSSSLTQKRCHQHATVSYYSRLQTWISQARRREKNISLMNIFISASKRVDSSCHL